MNTQQLDWPNAARPSIKHKWLWIKQNKLLTKLQKCWLILLLWHGQSQMVLHPTDVFLMQYFEVTYLNIGFALWALSYLRMNSLNVGVQVPFLWEGSRAEHAEVRFLSRVSHHVSLQHHLLVESLAAMGALIGSLTCGARTNSGQTAARRSTGTLTISS